MDNMKFHHSNNVKKWFSKKNVVVKYLPPYNPQLNPIEEVFSALKSQAGCIKNFDIYCGSDNKFYYIIVKKHLHVQNNLKIISILRI